MNINIIKIILLLIILIECKNKNKFIFIENDGITVADSDDEEEIVVNKEDVLPFSLNEKTIKAKKVQGQLIQELKKSPAKYMTQLITDSEWKGEAIDQKDSAADKETGKTLLTRLFTYPSCKDLLHLILKDDILTKYINVTDTQGNTFIYYISEAYHIANLCYKLSVPFPLISPTLTLPISELWYVKTSFGKLLMSLYTAKFNWEHQNNKGETVLCHLAQINFDMIGYILLAHELYPDQFDEVYIEKIQFSLDIKNYQGKLAKCRLPAIIHLQDAILQKTTYITETAAEKVREREREREREIANAVSLLIKNHYLTPRISKGPEGLITYLTTKPTLFSPFSHSANNSQSFNQGMMQQSWMPNQNPSQFSEPQLGAFNLSPSRFLGQQPQLPNQNPSQFSEPQLGALNQNSSEVVAHKIKKKIKKVKKDPDSN